MHYMELEELQKAWKGKVCLFGAGVYGRTWTYTLLKAAGFQIDFYCDNKIAPGTIIREGIKVCSLNHLYDKSKEVLVFVAVSEKYQKDIQQQLLDQGITNFIGMDALFLQSIAESILESNNTHVIDRYKKIVDDEEFCKEQFEYRMGVPLNLDNPKTFNEKIQWLKINDRNPDYVKMVDKYEVKKYVANLIGEEFIIPTLGVYDTFDDIKFEELPQQFVMKCTHDSHSVVVCDDKDNFDMEGAKNKLENALKTNLYWKTREWAYKNVKPRIIVEKRMVDESNKELKDYKYYCFNGIPKIMYIVSGRLDKNAECKSDFFDMEFRHLPIQQGYPNAKRHISEPCGFADMEMIARKLSANIPQVRIDFYNINGKIYFGEFTFYSFAGYKPFEPDEWDRKLGDWIILPELD